MTSQPSSGLLSILIPNYNYGQYIAEAVESVFRQDYDSIELIIVDDGSTDNSVKAIHQIVKRPNKLSRIEVIEMPRNSGKLAAINVGIEYCRGEFCILLDADDKLTDSYASRCINALAKERETRANIGFIYTNCMLIGPGGDHVGQGKSTEFDPTLIERFSFIPEPAVVLMSAMLEAAPFDEGILKGTKHHKWRRIINNGWHGHHIPEPLFNYRMHDKNLSGIGTRVLDEIDGGHRGERLLSGYWPMQTR